MRNDRLGMTMIVASLLAIAALVVLLHERQMTAHQAQTREQGLSLVRVLSRLPQDQLVPKTGHPALLHTVLQGSRPANPAYGAITDLRGTTLAEVTAAGALVPALPRAAEADAHVGQRALASPGDSRHITEFYGPLLDEGRVVGHVRVGFFDTSAGLPGLDQMPTVALLALPVFLLVPLFHFLVKREMRPLQEIGQQVQRLAESGIAPAMELTMGRDMRDFATRFSRFIETAQTRLREADAARFGSTVDNRLLGYRQEKIESVLHALPEAILVLDEAGGITCANAKLDPILGIDHAALAGRNVRDIELAPELAAFLARCQANPGHAFRGETLEFAPPSQPDRRIAASAYPLFSPRDPGSVLGVLVAFRDVTQEFLARHAGAEFVAHVSHELKSPLNVLRMYSEVLLDGSLESGEARIEAANVIKDETERMSALIGNLLSIARIENGSIALDRRRVRLRELLEEVFAETGRNAAGKDIRFELDLPQEIGAVLLDKDLFRIAIANLLGNAIKYNRPGGTVSLSAEETDAAVLVRVRDTGLGIPAPDQPKVFEKFFRSGDSAASARGGHGLGLYLVKQITELHHGNISVTSEPGSGSEFCMRFARIPAMLQDAARF